MEPVKLKQKIAYLYLSIVPFLTAALGFGVGHISYKIYLPVWIINVILMLASAWVLGLHFIRKADKEKKQHAFTGFALMIPWILLSVLFGFGALPETISAWVASATEQQIRYSILVIAGVFIALGFALLKEKLATTEGGFYATMGFTAVMIAIPLFIINMIFWGFYLTEFFTILTKEGLEKMPEWSAPVRKLFSLLSVAEVALTYMAIAAFALALKAAGWFRKTPVWIYISVSVFAFLVIILSVFSPEPFITAGFAVSIPAIPFIMPYFMGINLLKRLQK